MAVGYTVGGCTNGCLTVHTWLYGAVVITEVELKLVENKADDAVDWILFFFLYLLYVCFYTQKGFVCNKTQRTNKQDDLDIMQKMLEKTGGVIAFLHSYAKFIVS